MTAHYSTLYGVNVKSALMELKYFDVCSGALFSDVMHDILEGTLQYEVKLLLQYMVTEQMITPAKILRVMETAEYGYMEVADRPTPITRNTLYSKDNSLDQKGIVCSGLN